MRIELVASVIAGRDGDGFSADDFAAFDVVRGVANDESLAGIEIDAVKFLRATLGVGAEIVARWAVIGEGAEFEIVPDLIMGEFVFCTAFLIAGEQALRDAVMTVECIEDFENTGKDATFGASGQFNGQK